MMIGHRSDAIKIKQFYREKFTEKLSKIRKSRPFHFCHKILLLNNLYIKREYSSSEKLENQIRFQIKYKIFLKILHLCVALTKRITN